MRKDRRVHALTIGELVPNSGLLVTQTAPVLRTLRLICFSCTSRCCQQGGILFVVPGLRTVIRRGPTVNSLRLEDILQYCIKARRHGSGGMRG